MLPEHPKLNILLKHSTKQHTYFFSIKKCGESNCLSSKKPRLLTDIFQQVSHPPDPVADEDNPGHYKKFKDFYGQDTTEEFKPSKRTSNRNHTIQLNPLKQHALNRNITLECTECGKYRVVYSQKKASPGLCKKLKSVFSELFFTCGTKIQELDCNEYSMLYVWGNLTCISPSESLYCSATHHPCCFHCGTKHHLINESNHYPICSICKNVHKKTSCYEMKTKICFCLNWLNDFSLKVYIYQLVEVSLIYLVDIAPLFKSYYSRFQISFKILYFMNIIVNEKDIKCRVVILTHLVPCLQMN